MLTTFKYTYGCMESISIVEQCQQKVKLKNDADSSAVQYINTFNINYYNGMFKVHYYHFDAWLRLDELQIRLIRFGHTHMIHRCSHILRSFPQFSFLFLRFNSIENMSSRFSFFSLQFIIEPMKRSWMWSDYGSRHTFLQYKYLHQYMHK